jgi:hypothetical protein
MVLRYQLAYTLLARAEPDLAEADALLATMPPDAPERLSRRHTDALRALAAGDADLAAKLAEPLLLVDSLPDHHAAEVRITLARALLDLGETVRAQALVTEAQRLAPHIAAHHLLPPSTPGR